MSLLNLVRKRCSQDKDTSLSKSAKIYTLSEPKKDDIKWECDVSAEKKLKTFTDAKTFKSLNELSEKLEKYVNNHSKAKRKRKLDASFEIQKPRSFYITEACLHDCLERCINEDSFYSKSGIEYLIENHFITSTLHKILIDCIIKHNDLKLIKTILLSQSGLSESLILTLLQYVLSMVKNDIKGIENLYENTNLGTCPTSLDILTYMLVIFSFEVDFGKIREQLKLLVANEAAILLQILRYILLQVSPALIGDPEFISISTTVTEKVVIGWIDALISAQMMSFATSPALKPILEQLRLTTINQVNFYKIIGTLVPYMDVLKKVYELPPRSIEKYSVEIIRL